MLLICFFASIGSHPKYREVCCMLVPKLNDEEESIQNEVQKTFQSMWLSNDNPAIASRVIPST